jgi:hypothetical protein
MLQCMIRLTARKRSLPLSHSETAPIKSSTRWLQYRENTYEMLATPLLKDVR